MTDGNLPPSAIEAAPIEKASATVPVARDPLAPDPIIAQKMGYVGKFFGYGEEKKGNIAGLVAAASFFLLICCVGGAVISSVPETQNTFKTMITPLFGVLTGALTYITTKRSE